MTKVKMVRFLPLFVALAGCSTAADRMAKCEGEGLSKETCYATEQNRQTAINAAAEKQALENAANAVQHGQAAKASHVADPLRQASLRGPGIMAEINNGFTVARINGKKAIVKRFNENYYEISGGGFVLSLSLNENGVESASYTKTHSRINGILEVVQE